MYIKKIIEMLNKQNHKKTKIQGVSLY